VYLAVRGDDPSELLAIKCLKRDLASDSRFVDMFNRETKIALMLDHPAIVRTLDAGKIARRYYIAMEYIAGCDLNRLLRRSQNSNRPMPVPHAIYVTLQLTRALHYAHTLRSPYGHPLNIVNRDISPANIRISYASEVKLLDFGIAQAATRITSEIGFLKGKYAYMSPEQIRGLPVDCRSDIFSLGIVLYEMLTAQRLFHDNSQFGLMEKVRQQVITPPSKLNRRVQGELDAVVMSMLERDPRQRISSAIDLGKRMEPVLERYGFNRSELGEYVRSLFPADYRRDQRRRRISIASLHSALASSEATPTPQPDDSSQVTLQNRSRRPSQQSTMSWTALQDQDSPRNSTRTIWLAALALLVSGIVLLFLALR